MQHRSVVAPCFVLAVLLAASAAFAADPPCAVVYSHKDALMLVEPGGKPRKLGAGRQPAIAPDGRFVAFVEHGGDQAKARLVSLDVATGQVKVLAKPGGYLLSPRVSPDGRTVVFVRRADTGVSELWSVAEGARPVKLAQAGGQAGDDFFEPMISPDGARIVYQDMRFLHLMSINGKDLVKTELAPFADGRKEVFTSSDRFAMRPGSGEMAFTTAVAGSKAFQEKVPDLSSAIFLYDPATKVSTRLTRENMTAFAPAWTPDGREIVFCGYTDALAGSAYPFRIYRMVPGMEPVEIGPGEDPMTPGK
jgi:Tol biopolymer transport system component